MISLHRYLSNLFLQIDFEIFACILMCIQLTYTTYLHVFIYPNPMRSVFMLLWKSWCYFPLDKQLDLHYKMDNGMAVVGKSLLIGAIEGCPNKGFTFT